MSRIEQAVSALEDACAVLSDYDSLCDRQMVYRQQLLRRVAGALSGKGDASGIISHAAGLSNETANKISVAYQLARCEPGNASFKTKKSREWAINVLSFLLNGNSRSSLEEIGASMGDDLYNSVKGFLNSGDLIFESTTSSAVGRCLHPDRSKIQDAWVGKSYDSTRVSVDGVPLRVVKGSFRNIVVEISKDLKCSEWAASFYRPCNITVARKLSDLCLNCESLRRVRIELINLARESGLFIQKPSELDGQKAVASIGQKALEFWYSKSSAGVVPDEVSNLLDQHSIPQWHEDLGKRLRNELEVSQNNTPTIVFDFASDLILRSHRGDAREFYKPLKVSHFGMMVTTPSGGGKKKTHYIDILTPSESHTSRSAVHCLTHGIAKAKEIGLVDVDAPLNLYCDKASHFNSGEGCYGALMSATKGFPKVCLTYHVCYHGKTSLSDISQPVG